MRARRQVGTMRYGHTRCQPAAPRACVPSAHPVDNGCLQPPFGAPRLASNLHAARPHAPETVATRNGLRHIGRDGHHNSHKRRADARNQPAALLRRCWPRHCLPTTAGNVPPKASALTRVAADCSGESHRRNAGGVKASHRCLASQPILPSCSVRMGAVGAPRGQRMLSPHTPPRDISVSAQRPPPRRAG